MLLCTGSIQSCLYNKVVFGILYLLTNIPPGTSFQAFLVSSSQYWKRVATINKFWKKWYCMYGMKMFAVIWIYTLPENKTTLKVMVLRDTVISIVIVVQPTPYYKFHKSVCSSYIYCLNDLYLTVTSFLQFNFISSSLNYFPLVFPVLFVN